ncbi:MAG: hypothetical protein QNL58_08310 [Octadecabacter sp.]|nr:hypothetical protein [Octadecabacter sp.]
MTLNRRLFLTACGAITIAACAPTTPMSQTNGTPALPDDLRPVPSAN